MSKAKRPEYSSDEDAKPKKLLLASSSSSDEGYELIDIPEIVKEKKEVSIPDYSVPVFNTSSIPSDLSKHKNSEYTAAYGGACLLSVGVLIFSTVVFAHSYQEGQSYNHCISNTNFNCTDKYSEFDLERNGLLFSGSMLAMGLSAFSTLITAWATRNFYNDYIDDVKSEKRPFAKFANSNKITAPQEEYLKKQNEMLKNLGKTENQYISTQWTFSGGKGTRTNPNLEIFLSEVKELVKSNHDERYLKIADNISEGHPEFRNAALKNFSGTFKSLSQKIDTMLRGIILHFDLDAKNLNPGDWAEPIYNVAKELKGGGTPFNLYDDRYKEHNQQVIQKLIPLVEANRFTKRLDVLQESTKIPNDMINNIAVYMTQPSVKREEIGSFIERAKKVTFERQQL